MSSAGSRKELLDGVRRVVVKVGTGVLTREGGGFDRACAERLAEELCNLAERGKEVVLVSSGAIALGGEVLGFKEKPRDMPVKQAAAAVGQSRLIGVYREVFNRRGRRVGQILLTHADLSHRTCYLNARRTIAALLELGAVPIINENDSVAVEEIMVGDNDLLSAHVVGLTTADLLVILTDTEGLYDGDPRRQADAHLITLVENADQSLERYAGGEGSQFSTGGMVTKLKAAQQAAAFGVPSIIASGKRPGILAAIFEGEEVGTLFIPAGERLSARKTWIAYTLKPVGCIVVDEGARRALVDRGKSLLPSGVAGVEGEFGIGEAVTICDEEGRELAQGLAGYSAAEIDRIRGRRTSEIEGILGYRYLDEVVHRDDMVLV